ncbi:MAG: hypothetical protein FWF44_09585, partial [Defluviitaleaceae bacterium]|nr:hypothetical protein [Defluviitaleaceae bacterium]
MRAKRFLTAFLVICLVFGPFASVYADERSGRPSGAVTMAGDPAVTSDDTTPSDSPAPDATDTPSPSPEDIAPSDTPSPVASDATDTPSPSPEDIAPSDTPSPDATDTPSPSPEDVAPSDTPSPDVTETPSPSPDAPEQTDDPSPDASDGTSSTDENPPLTDDTPLLGAPTITGNGTSTSPYQITNETQLTAISQGLYTNNFSAYYILMNNIAITASSWTPIGTYSLPFTGNFDGKGFTISNVNVPSNSYAGFFGYINAAAIKNLGVTGTVTGTDYAGLLVAYNNNGVITQCHTSGVVNGTKSGGSYGGLAGYNNSSTITMVSYENCYSTANVGDSSSGQYTNAGGLVGYLNWGVVRYCYAAGKVTSVATQNNAGGLVGQNAGLVTVSYYDGTTSGRSDVGKGISVPTNAMYARATFAGWDFVNVWSGAIGAYPSLIPNGVKAAFTTHGAGTAANPYLISDAAGLVALAAGEYQNTFTAGTYFQLTANISLPIRYWTPIGNANIPFKGNFDGKGFTVSGVNVSSDPYAGLFGFIENASFKNLGVSGTVNSTNYGGLLAAYNHNSTLQQCYTSGAVNGSQSAGYLGGLVGYNDISIMTTVAYENCYSSASVVDTSGSASADVGGLVGFLDWGIMRYCYSTGKVTTSAGANFAGGLVGNNAGL